MLEEYGKDSVVLVFHLKRQKKWKRTHQMQGPKKKMERPKEDRQKCTREQPINEKNKKNEKRKQMQGPKNKKRKQRKQMQGPKNGAVISIRKFVAVISTRKFVK